MPSQTRSSSSRPTVAAFIGGLRAPELIIAVGTTLLPIWAWFAYMLRPPQDPGTFAVIAGTALVAGGVLQMALWAFVRAPGSLHERLALSSLAGSQPPVYMIAIVVPVLVGVVLLVATPSSTSMRALDPDFTVGSAVALLTLLGVAAATFGGAVIFWLVLVPLALLAAAVIPRRSEPATAGRPATAIDGVSVGEVVTFALMLFAVSGFAVALAVASPAHDYKTRVSMIEQFGDVVTLQGAVLPTMLAMISAAAIVVLVILHRHFQGRRLAGTSTPGTSTPR